MSDLVIQGLGKTYPATDGTPIRPALHDVTVRFQAGEFVAVMGHSGSGKSTFMNLLGCLDRPTCGRYEIGGEDVARLSPDALAAIRNRFFGFVFQGFNLLPRLSAMENVALPLMYAGIGQHQRKARAADQLQRVGLGHLLERRPAQMSGGQQQRVAIARALAGQPAWILADEPTGNLDSATSEEVMHLLQELNREQGIGIILVTHEQDIADFAPRHLRFSDGRLMSDSLSHVESFDGAAA